MVMGFDDDVRCKYAYQTNNHPAVFLKKDIRELGETELSDFFAEATIRVLVGCAPCQPFSAHTRRMTQSEDCELIREFARLIRESDPDLVSMENVPGLEKHWVFKELLSVLLSSGHKISCGVRDFFFYGVPQHRKRLVLIASKLGEPNLPPYTTRRTTVGDFISDVDPIENGETHKTDVAHRTLPLSAKNLARIRQSKPGGDSRDWDDALLNPSHATAHYPGPYGRMKWDSPAPTITTQFCYFSTGRFGHPIQDRAISIREAALLQTFPPSYELVDPSREQPVRELARQVGNAVPSLVGELIGNALYEAALNG